MIDIFSFLNSKDIADYLRATHFAFTAQQAAYFVNISMHVTLAEKIAAWRYGACENYLNLEYYKGPLDGDLRQLAIASATVKGNLGPDGASNFNRLAALDSHLTRNEEK